MFAIIAKIVQGFVSGVAGPLAQAYEKNQDVSLEGFKAGTDADRQTYASYLDYQARLQALKLQASNWWGPRVLYMVAGFFAAFHFAAVCLVSSSTWLHDRWTVLAMPKPYDSYEGWVIGSLFVTALAKGPISAASAWLHRK